MASSTLFVTVALLTSTLVAAAAKPALKAPAGPPVAARRPVVDQYFGVSATDDYRWLEDWSSPEVKAWSDGQNRYTRAFLRQLPGVAAIRSRVKELEGAPEVRHFGLRFQGGVLFALCSAPPKQQPLLVALASPDDPSSERVLLDPNAIDPTGSTTIDFFAPSLDGKLVAVSLSQGGTESGTVRVVEVATGKELPDRVPRVNGGTAGGSVAWNADRSGFYHTLYPAPGERPSADLAFFQQVYYHKLGTPAENDTSVLGKDLPKIAEISLESSQDGRWLLATVANGDGGEFAHYLMKPPGEWVRFADFSDRVIKATFGPDDSLYLLSRSGAPRGKLVRLAPESPALEKATTVVPESEAVISDLAVGPGKLYVLDVVGGPTQVRIFDLTGKRDGLLPVLPVSTVSEIVRLAGDAVIYRAQSYLNPPAWYRFTPGTGKAILTGLFTASPADFSDCEVVRELATSKDGTKVPLSILRRKGTSLDGSNPTLLTAYGGFAVSTKPEFSARWRVWLEQGGVFAEANIRGGGEFGEAWHLAGNLTHKQNVFDDFAACARFLIDAGYTRPEKLAIEGGSNGGLLMGAMITQHPELFRAVVADVGLFDMLRYEQFPNGVFNVTEYGSVRDPDQFKAIYAYSPYQHVADGAAYPAVLLLTGANDPRVDPANSRKMAARLQAATSSKLPVLLRTSATTGHIGTPLAERIAHDTDLFAFLFAQLQAPYKPAVPPAVQEAPAAR